MNWGQSAEIIILFFVPLVIKKIDLRLTMIIGLLALVVRFVAFYFGTTSGLDWFLFTAILVHGIIYGFFSVGGQIYVDRVASKDLKNQAQGFIFLITFGFGILAGNFLSAWLIGYNTITDNLGHANVQWDNVWAVAGAGSLFVFLFFSIFFKYNIKKIQ